MVIAILPILDLVEWNVERFPASGQTPKSLKLQFKFGDLGVCPRQGLNSDSGPCLVGCVSRESST